MRIVDVDRNTKGRGRLTTPISPIVETTPTRATDQKSATISEIQRSHSRHTKGSRAVPCAGPQNQSQRGDQIQQRRALMTHLVDQRGCDAAADHAFARNANDRDRIPIATGQARARPSDRGPTPRSR